MNLREALVLNTGGFLAPGFKERAFSFGAAGRDRLERFNSLLPRARAGLPAYDAACGEALGAETRLASIGELSRLPILGRGDLSGYAGGSALARLESGGTGSSGRVETRLDFSGVAARYAALLSVLKETGWRMGEKIAAFHPVEYGYFQNFGAMARAGQFGRMAFEFLQQYVLYRLVHNRKNLYYDRGIFSGSAAAGALAESAASENPALIITRPDALMAVLKSLRGAPPLRFKGLKAVLTVGTALGETVRREVKEKLGVDVFNMYASTELGYIALSCRHSGGWLHVDEAGHILETGEGGSLICTDLDNALMPLLRYDTGDIGELAARACPCGRSGPLLKVRGRKKSGLETAGGTIYEAELIDRVFPSDLPFFQLDASAGRIILPPGSGEEQLSLIRTLLALPAGSYSAAGPGNFRISSSGKFCYLP